MVRKPLILTSLLLLTGCATTASDAYSRAKVAEALASTPITLPEALPDACTAKIGRVAVTRHEAWVSIIKRWEIVAENRNQQADDCAEWWDDYRANVGTTTETLK